MAERDSVEALERLGHDEVDSGSLLALTHTQRYRFAARFAADARVTDLCCGVGYGSLLLSEVAANVTGVDNDPAAVSAATDRADNAAVFVVADACEYLERLDPAETDLIVCFEGIEHVADTARLADALARHIRSGVRFLGSVPNSTGFCEDNPFHTVDFGYEEAVALFRRFGDFALLDQRPAEGSIIRYADERARTLEGTVTISGLDDTPAWASHWLVACNIADGALHGVVAEMRAVAVPNHQRYMRALEHANEELYRTNLRLSRDHLGKHDAAAGITIGRLERAVARATESEREALHRLETVEQALSDAIEAARVNDELFQEARRTLFERDAAVRRSLRRRVSDRLRRRRFVRHVGRGIKAAGRRFGLIGRG